jgi:hypothetical protein
MKLKFTYPVIAFLVIIYQVQGQDFKNNFSLSMGAGYIARQDLIFSPFIHNDFSPLNIGLEYKRRANFQQNLKIRFASFNPMLISPYEYTIDGEIKIASQHSFTLIDLDYSIGKIINRTEKIFTTVGPLFTTDMQILNYVYGRIGSFGYYSTLGLGGFITNEYQINEKSRLHARFSLPIFSWLSRSPYLVNDDEFIENISSHSDLNTFFAFIGDGQLTTFYNLQTFDLEANYTYKLHSRWEIGAGYHFEFIHSKEPRSLRSFRNSLLVSTNFKF